MCDALEFVGVEVVPVEALHDGSSQHRFNVKKELIPLFVGKQRKRIIRRITQSDRVQGSVSIESLVMIVLVIQQQSLVFNPSAFHCQVLAKHFGSHSSLSKNSPALVEPEVLPLLTSDEVAAPGVNDFVDGNVHLVFVSRVNGG